MSVPDQEAPVNYLSADQGASVVECSHEAENMGSAAANVLIDREDRIWIANVPPQHITLGLSRHAPIRYVGWYVWHDYLTNPKVVDVRAGSSISDLQHVITCTAYAGSGVQLWELTDPIPADTRLISFEIKSTFGGSYTYVNRLYAFSEHPGSQFAPKTASPRPAHRAIPSPDHRIRSPRHADPVRSPGGGMSDMGSPLHMSALLRELDHDIRALHPLRAAVPPPLPETTGTDSAYRSAPRERNSLDEEHETSDVTMARISTLERSVVSLVRTVEAQSRAIDGLRETIASQSHTASATAVVPPGARPVDIAPESLFPEEALRKYVEDVMAPKLAKHSRRFEARVTQRMDEHLEELLRSVDAAVDERVSRHMRRIALSSDSHYRHVAEPRGLKGPSSSRRH